MRQISKYHIALGFAAIVIFHLLLHFSYLKFTGGKSIIQKSDEEFYSELKELKQLKYLFMGDSHVNGIQTDLVDSSLRFNSFGESYIQTYYKLKYLIEEEQTPVNYVVLPFDLHSFSSYRSNRITNDIYWKKYIDYAELAAIKDDNLFRRKWLAANYFAYFSKGKEIYEFVSRKLRIPSLSNKTETIADRVNYHFGNCQLVDDDLLLFFNRIIRLCKNNNIKVILIKYPVRLEYYNQVSKLIKTDRYYNELSDRIDDFESLEVIDYHNIFFTNEKDIFIDADHLSHYGAELFSVKLGAYLKK